MKLILNFLLGSLLTCVFLFSTSCTREAVRPESGPETVQASENCPSRAEFVAGKTYREYLQDYREMPAEDRLCMWQDKLSHSLQFFTEPGQQGFITNAMNLLTLTRMQEGNEEGFEDSFRIQAEMHFTFEQVANVFMVLHDYDHPPAPMGPNAGDEKGDCECYYALWCGAMATCDVGTCIKSPGCGILGGTDCSGLCDNRNF